MSEIVKNTSEPVLLNLLEIEILIYLLNGRTALGPHAKSAKTKLNRARKTIVGQFDGTEIETGGVNERRGDFNIWDRRKESGDPALPLFEINKCH